jgi:hypothetical protein
MTPRDCLGRPLLPRALQALLVTLAGPSLPALLSLAALCGCAGEPPPSCGAPGLARSCPCAGGGQGAQECGPYGAWTACVCGGGGDAGVDAGDAGDARDASEDAGDTVDTAEASSVPDASPDAAPTTPDAADDAPNASDAPDSPPLPPSLDSDPGRVEIWQGVDGSPMQPVAGSCVVSAGVVSWRATRARGTYDLNTPRRSATILCAPGLPGDFGDSAALYVHRGPYGSPGPGSTQRVNLRFRGTIRAGLCEEGGPAVTVEVYALGCPVM